MNGADMHALATDLYPICRSITGDGLRTTLKRLQQHVPLEIREVKSGTQVLDWTVPKEWNIRDAYVADAAGKRVIDFRQSSLHILNYSTPIRKTMPLAELKPHLFTLPDHPDWVPYRTSYYSEAWGFCAAHRVVQALPAGDYEVVIDSTLEPGSLSYGELVIPGETRDEVLLSCHSCHPSLANDNLSGIAVAVALARQLATQERRRLTYRFLFIPGTIGSIAWLAGHADVIPHIRHGLVLSCVGDAGAFTYKRSRQGDAPVDRAVAHVLRHTGTPHTITDFVPYGYDERQYCSPGFNLAVGCFMRTPNGQYPEYHTSADNLSLVKPEALEGSLAAIGAVLAVLEGDGRYRNLSPKGEPQLGKRGLYGSTGGAAHLPGFEFALLWVLNFSDGSHSLLDIAERAGMPFAQIRAAADALLAKGLLEAA